MRALLSLDFTVSDLDDLNESIQYAKTQGYNIRVAKVTPLADGSYKANVDVLIGRQLAEDIAADFGIDYSDLRVNSARSYKLPAKVFNLAKNAVKFVSGKTTAINPA